MSNHMVTVNARIVVDGEGDTGETKATLIVECSCGVTLISDTDTVEVPTLTEISLDHAIGATLKGITTALSAPASGYTLMPPRAECSEPCGDPMCQVHAGHPLEEDYGPMPPRVECSNPCLDVWCDKHIMGGGTR